MVDRTTKWWRTFGVVVVGLIFLNWPALASADSTWHATLVRQSYVANVSHGTHASVHFVVRTGGSNGDTDAIAVSIYPHVVTRSDLAPIVDGIGDSSLALSNTGSFPLNCRTNGVATFEVTVGPSAGTANSTCGGAQPYLDLGCSAHSCDGVYPVALTATNGTVTSTIWTLLTVVTSTSQRPISAAWILTSNPVTTSDAEHETKVLHAIVNLAKANLSVAVDYQGVGRLIFDSSTTATTYRRALVGALVSTHHELVGHPPDSIDFASLAANHLNGDLTKQIQLATGFVGFLAGKQSDSSVAMGGSGTPADLVALSAGGVHDLVLPDGTFAQSPSSTLQWGTPFRVEGAPSSTVAMSTDSLLRQLATSSNGTAGLRTALTIGSLALLYYEAPFAPATRTVVIDSPMAHLDPAYVSEVIGAMRDNPLVRLVTVGNLFPVHEIGANGYPAVRTLARVSATAWSASNVTAARALDSNLQSFGGSISTYQPTTPIEAAELYAERRGDAGERQREFNAADSSLNDQLDNIHIDATTITLTGSGTPLPLTMTSSSPYVVSGFLVLTAPRVTFPQGNVIPLTVNASTTSIRVPANINGSGNFTLVARFVSIDRKIVIALGAIQVRSTTNSVVGYVLTGGALFIIALWWWRTTRRQSKGRHAP